MTRPASNPTAPTTRPESEERTHQDIKALRPFKVVLHNDDVNTFAHVIRSLCRSVPGMAVKRAEEIAMEAHTTGKAIVIVCPLELAEHYRDRLQSCALTATIEPA